MATNPVAIMMSDCSQQRLQIMPAQQQSMAVLAWASLMRADCRTLHMAAVCLHSGNSVLHFRHADAALDVTLIIQKQMQSRYQRQMNAKAVYQSDHGCLSCKQSVPISR
jgi:hypothetical protein